MREVVLPELFAVDAFDFTFVEAPGLAGLGTIFGLDPL